MQFVVTGHDGTDAGALDRRMAAREAHMASFMKRRERGEHLYAGALLDEEETMIGSVMIVDYPSREALDAWLAEEPYVLGKVWETIEVQRCNVPPALLR